MMLQFHMPCLFAISAMVQTEEKYSFQCEKMLVLVFKNTLLLSEHALFPLG